MATTTPNYGWVVPTSTDLVKNGATAIETLGDSADATVKALNPATTLGDLQYRSATANTMTRLGIGSTGNVLTVAGGVPTWAAPASGVTFSGARAWASGTQSIPNATATVLTWNSESFDTNSYHSTSSNTGRMTVPTTGYYLLTGVVIMNVNATGLRVLDIKKNGSTSVSYIEVGATTAGGTGTTLQFTTVLYAAANDYFEMTMYQNSGGNLLTYIGGEQYNFFSIVSLGA